MATPTQPNTNGAITRADHFAATTFSSTTQRRNLRASRFAKYTLLGYTIARGKLKHEPRRTRKDQAAESHQTIARPNRGDRAGDRQRSRVRRRPATGDRVPRCPRWLHRRGH